MNTNSLHSSIVRRTIETINEGRLDDFMKLFTPNAAVLDGPTYQGYEAIRAWAQRETFGVKMHVDVVREKDPEGMVVEIQVKSQGGYSGPGTFAFSLREDLIERLVIS